MNPPPDKNQKKNQKPLPKKILIKTLCKDERFRRAYHSAVERYQLKIEKREIDRWSGVLNGIPSFRYLLICKHLRLIEESEQPWIPEQWKKNATHEWWCWYQRRGGNFPIKILFHQYGGLGKAMLIQASHVHPAHMRAPAIFRVEKALDECAKSITEYIADVLLDLSEIRLRLPNVSVGEYIATSHLLHTVDDPHFNLWDNGGEEALEEFWLQVIRRGAQQCPTYTGIDTEEEM